MNSAPRDYRIDVFDRLWLKLEAIYGYQWKSRFGLVDGAVAVTWLDGLGDMSALDIQDGLQACLTRTDTRPPNLPEFRQLCKPPAKPLAHQPHKALSPPRADKVTAAAEFANIRVILAEGRARLDAGKYARAKALAEPPPAETETATATATAAETETATATGDLPC